MPNPEKEKTAVHEAGHAVLAIYAGGIVTELYLKQRLGYSEDGMCVQRNGFSAMRGTIAVAGECAVLTVWPGVEPVAKFHEQIRKQGGTIPAVFPSDKWQSFAQTVDLGFFIQDERIDWDNVKAHCDLATAILKDRLPVVKNIADMLLNHQGRKHANENAMKATKLCRVDADFITGLTGAGAKYTDLLKAVY
jgi:hypothetical protein